MSEPEPDRPNYDGDFDIEPILSGWDYRPGEVAARWITDREGRRKIQMRMALGVLQMEPDGRPDGQRPHGFESLLDHFEHRLQAHFEEYRSTDGFILSADDSDELRQEAYAYYLRYLCLFRLEDYERAERDTRRNLRVLDLMLHHTEDEEDRLSMEQYRPYIMMMNARARASVAMRASEPLAAAHALQSAIAGIKEFYRQVEREFEGLEAESLIEASEELIVLEEMLKPLQDEVEPPLGMGGAPQDIPHQEPMDGEDPKKLPTSVIDSLRDELEEAVINEDYVRAASLRDRIKALEKVVHKRHGGGIHG